MMNLEIHTAAVEQRVREQIRSGRFHDTDELLAKALDALDNQTTTTPAPAQLHDVPELPVWHLGAMGPFHRRDIYNDVR